MSEGEFGEATAAARNPFVRDPDPAMRQLSRLLNIEEHDQVSALASTLLDALTQCREQQRAAVAELAGLAAREAWCLAQVDMANRFIEVISGRVAQVDGRQWLPFDAGRTGDTLLRRAFEEHCRPATVDDYVQWLAGYRARGGSATHDYLHQLGSGLGAWFVLESAGVTLPPLYGANAINVIVPAGLDLTVADDPDLGQPGHSAVFLMDGFTTPGRWVPTYEDAP